MAWLGIERQGWSAGAGCGYHTSPAQAQLGFRVRCILHDLHFLEGCRQAEVVR